MNPLRLIEYLNTEETVAFVGAGVARELNIPTWPELARALRADLPAPLLPHVAEADRLLAEESYGEFMGWLADYDAALLYTRAAALLQDTLRRGRVSSFIANFPFKAVITTNFDHSLVRHFREAGTAIETFGNTQVELASVDVDAYRCLVKIHSDFEHPETLIFTSHQFRQARSDGKWAYYQQFLTAQLTRRCIVIGYSFRDPDIELILEQLAFNLRPDRPVCAIMADVPPERIRAYKRDFNVEVLSYRNDDGSHQGLVDLFEMLDPFVSGQHRPVPDLAIELGRAQSLYLWSRLHLGSSGRLIQVDAIKALVLFELENVVQTRHILVQNIGHLVGLSEELLSSTIDTAVDALIASGDVLAGPQGELRLAEAAQSSVQQGFGQHDRLKNAFISQTVLDFETIFPAVTDGERTEAAQTVLAAVVSVFHERGVEVAASLEHRSDANIRQSANLFATLYDHGSSLSNESMKFSFVRYVVNIVTAPGPQQRAYLEHLARAFFCLEALAMDPDGHEARRDFLSFSTLLVDSNISIPVIARSSASSDYARDVCSLAVGAGYTLLTTDGFVEEVHGHGTWAQDLVAQFGEQSPQVMSAARGGGEYRRNAFLDGFVIHAGVHGGSFDDYLRACVGGAEFTYGAIRQELAAHHNIGFLELNEIALLVPELFEQRDAVAEYIKGQAERLRDGKRPRRVRAEADVYVAVANWGALGRPGATILGDLAPASSGVLSSGGFLNRVAMSGPLALGRSIVVRPDGLYGFLLKSGMAPRANFSFREILLSPLFDTSEHFIDKDVYGAFFRPLISSAEQIFRDHLLTFQRYVDEALTPAWFEDIEPLHRPAALETLQVALDIAIGRNQVAASDMEEAVRAAEARLQETTARQARAEDILVARQGEIKKVEKTLRNIQGAADRELRKRVARSERKNTKRRS